MNPAVPEDTLITGPEAETATHFHISYQCGCGKESVGILDLLEFYLISRLDAADNAYSICIFKVCSPVKNSLLSSVQFSLVQDGIYALGKAHMRSTPSLRSFSNVALETVPILV